jgi:hypothetical protein
MLGSLHKANILFILLPYPEDFEGNIRKGTLNKTTRKETV